jgi:hypothetical protein
MLSSQAIIEAIMSVTKDWCRQAKAEERHESARLRREEALTRRRSDRVSLRDAVFHEMRTGIEQASGRGKLREFPKRNLYYSVRKLIQTHTSIALTYTYFENLLQDWEANHGPVRGKYCDPRGYFVEPHTGNVIPLGTREVENYTIPPWRYDKILYVEKKGFHELFRMARIAERYDIGIICAEGYAADAAKLLMARAQQTSNMRVGCLHDADPYGYNIVLRLRDTTRTQTTIDVVDMGLKIEEAVALELDTEEFIRDKALPKGLSLNDMERKYFEGVPCGVKGSKQLYRCCRVELNSLAADPDRFIEYVEAKLRQHGFAKKLVPPATVVLDRARNVRAELIRERARATLAELLNADVEELTQHFAQKISLRELPSRVATWARTLEPCGWDEHLEDEVRKAVAALDPMLRESLLVRIRELARRL